MTKYFFSGSNFSFFHTVCQNHGNLLLKKRFWQKFRENNGFIKKLLIVDLKKFFFGENKFFIFHTVRDMGLSLSKATRLSWVLKKTSVKPIYLLQIDFTKCLQSESKFSFFTTVWIEIRNSSFENLVKSFYSAFWYNK